MMAKLMGEGKAQVPVGKSLLARIRAVGPQ